MKNYFTRVYDLLTGEITQLNLFDTEEEAQTAFNTSARVNAINYGQTFWRLWTDKDGVKNCDYGDYGHYLQMGKLHK